MTSIYALVNGNSTCFWWSDFCTKQIHRAPCIAGNFCRSWNPKGCLIFCNNTRVLISTNYLITYTVVSLVQQSASFLIMFCLVNPTCKWHQNGGCATALFTRKACKLYGSAQELQGVLRFPKSGTTFPLFVWVGAYPNVYLYLVITIGEHESVDWNFMLHHDFGPLFWYLLQCGRFWKGNTGNMSLYYALILKKVFQKQIYIYIYHM